MTLFPRTSKSWTNPDSQRRQSRTAPARRVRQQVARESAPLPDFMHHLDLLCRQTVAHQLPVRMKFISEALSDRGRQTAVYACPFAGCTWREGWVIDNHNHSHKPFRLWAGFYRH
jgi:hypothetical protein